MRPSAPTPGTDRPPTAAHGSTPRYRGRFAPSPTGPLHPGSLVAALGSWLLARHAGGEWLVRIEDLDPPREIAGAAERQLATLAAFGLESDRAVLRQSQRHAAYQQALDGLLRSDAAFFCHCSRSDVARTGGIHRRCAHARRRSNPAVRLRVGERDVVRFDDLLQGPTTERLARTTGDFVLRRADGLWAYQLAVVVDDAHQGITDVVRGADLLDSTARQIMLQRKLNVPAPRYAHLPVLLDDRGHKLSKSTAATPIDASDPLPALRLAWAALGQDPEILSGPLNKGTSLNLMLQTFEPGRIPRATGIKVAAVHNRISANRT